MYAIVEIAGQQFKVAKDQQIFVHRLSNEEGSKVSFDEVLLVDNEGKIEVGAPVIKGTSVNASVVRHLQGDKVIVFKKKRRKGYQKSNGHRQQLTEILIETIGKPAKKAAPAKIKEEAPAEEAVEAKKTVKKEAAPKKVAEPKKAVEKKEAALKAEVKNEETKN